MTQDSMDYIKLSHKPWQPGIKYQVQPANDSTIICSYANMVGGVLRFNDMLVVSEIASVQADLIISILVQGPRY